RVPGSTPKIILEVFCKEKLFLKRQTKPLNKNIKIFINYFLGPALFIWLSYSIYRQIRNQPDLDVHLQQIKEAIYGRNAWQLWMVVMLMLVNWGIEARKWQVLLKGIQKISFLRSFKAILAGVSFALNTPNRIGEYGGRILYVEDGKRFKAVSLTIAGSFSQIIITLLMGTIGLVFLQDELSGSLGIESSAIWIKFLTGIVATVTLVCLLIYFRLNWLIKGVERLPGLSRFVEHISVLEDLNVTILLRVLSLSFTRFMVFVIQYNLLLQAMQVDVTWWQGFWAVSVLFLLLAIWPTIALLELGLRWEYSLLLFKLFSKNTVGIYATATGIWLINLALPALIGSLFILGIKIFKER
ncbi:MAG: lysylphosphatidylglycerol synthase domain-containing protein, partial [Chitinophagaceae bacterium]|nr:lysylphosphatidylglycerol synthase domain-containing protein [Chitinophagaceae bacterium]